MMSSQFFLPHLDIFRRDRRGAEAFGNPVERYKQGTERFSEIQCGDLCFDPLRMGLDFGMRGNGAHNIECEPAIGGQTFLLASRNLGQGPPRMLFSNRYPISGFETRILKSAEPDGLLSSVHFMDEESDPMTPFDRVGLALEARSIDRFPLGGVTGEYERLRTKLEREMGAEVPKIDPWSPTSGLKSLYGNTRIQDQLRASRNLDRRLSTLDGMDGDTDWRRRPGNLEQNQDGLPLPFGRAMKWLHGELGKATKFYSKFQDDYDREISSVKKYASAEVMNKLWVMRVSGKEDRRVSVWSRDEPQDDDGTVKYKEKFNERRNKLHGALAAALNANLSYGAQQFPKTTIIESRKRLQQKVSTASKHILDLLNSVFEAREHCEELLSELRLLKEMINPNDRKNKSLYCEDGEYIGGIQETGGEDDVGYVEDSDSEQLQDQEWNQ